MSLTKKFLKIEQKYKSAAIFSSDVLLSNYVIKIKVDTFLDIPDHVFDT